MSQQPQHEALGTDPGFSHRVSVSAELFGFPGSEIFISALVLFWQGILQTSSNPVVSLENENKGLPTNTSGKKNKRQKKKKSKKSSPPSENNPSHQNLAIIDDQAPENNNASRLSTELDKKEVVVIAGDSLVINIVGGNMNKTDDEHFYVVKAFPGATTTDMEDYISSPSTENLQIKLSYT